jgi:Zn ribbon nucleic-acid-binding protein
MCPPKLLAKLKSLLRKTCQHPEDQRWVFTAMGVEEWECKLCGYRFRKPLKEVRKRAPTRTR